MAEIISYKHNLTGKTRIIIVLEKISVIGFTYAKFLIKNEIRTGYFTFDKRKPVEIFVSNDHYEYVKKKYITRDDSDY